MIVAGIVNTRRPERVRLLTDEEAARLRATGWTVGESVELTDGPWIFAAGDRITSPNIPTARLAAALKLT